MIRANYAASTTEKKHKKYMKNETNKVSQICPR